MSDKKFKIPVINDLIEKLQIMGRAADAAWFSIDHQQYDEQGTAELHEKIDAIISAVTAATSALAQQPAPVSVPDERHTVGGLDHGWKGEYNLGWNDCRAAMLAAAPEYTAQEGNSHE